MLLFVHRLCWSVREEQSNIPSTDGRKAQIAPCCLSVCDPDPFSAGSLLSLSHSETTCSINTHCRQNHGNLTGQRECENERGSLCVSARVFVSVSLCLHAARATPALVQMLDIQKTCSWWIQTFPPWRRAKGIARYQTSYCRTNVQQRVSVVLLHNQ